MKQLKKFLTSFTICLLLVSQVSPLAYAQEFPASSSADFLDPDQDQALIRKEALIESAITSLTSPSGQTQLNNEEDDPKIRAFKKKTFKSTENIPITIENERADNVSVEVFNVDGEKVDVEVKELTTSTPAVLLVEPPTDFKPGRYRLKITDQEGDVSTQDFTWGVLAINTNKSIYQQNDIAKLQMAVLDEAGKMVCDAKVTLSIKAPDGNIKEYKTDNNTIKVNPDCYQKRYTPVPDFEADYNVSGGEGIYAMTLSAQTKNGTYTITDSFQAKEQVAFDVERLANTRIYPPVTYPVEFKITTHQDFTGEISEVVPENFLITSLEKGPHFHVFKQPGSTPAEKHEGHMSLPFAGYYEMTQGFGVEETDPLMAAKYEKYGLVGHDGIDYALPTDTPVLAVDDGIIAAAQTDGDYGTTVVIQHTWGKSYYGHLSKIEKATGESITKGDRLGLSGNTGLSTGPHLHFGIKLNQNDVNNGYYGKVNPLAYFATNSPQVAGIATSSAMLRPSEQGTQTLLWNVSMKKGETITLGYRYRAPLESPQFYTLGPLAFYEKEETSGEHLHSATDSANTQLIASPSADTHNNEVIQQSSKTTLVFQETRKWQIAADDMENPVRTGPTIADYNETTWNDGTKPKSTGSISWQAGDKIVALGLTDDSSSSMTTPTATGLTFVADTAQAASNNCWGNSWTAQPTAAGSSTVSINQSGTEHYGLAVWVFRNSDGFGTRAASTANTSGTTETVSLTRTKSNSAVVAIVCDWNANTTANATFTPTESNNREVIQSVGKYSVFAADWADEGATGTTAYGISYSVDPGTTGYTKIAYEIYGCDSQPGLSQLMRHGQWFASCGVEKPFFF